MTRPDLRLVPLACAVWGIELLCVYVPKVAGLVTVVGIAGSVVLLSLARAAQRTPGVDGGRGRRMTRQYGGLMALLLGIGGVVGCCVLWALPSRDAAALHDGHIVEVVADVTSSTVVGRDGRLWFDAHLVSIGSPGHVDEVLSVPMRIGVENPEGGGIDLGARVLVTGQAGQGDAGERAALVLFGTRASVVTPAAGVFAVAAGARAQFVERAARLPEPGAGLLPGLAVGDTTAVGAELNEAMLRSGLSHLTAVSGANCAIVVAAAFWLVALCGGGRRLRVGVSLVALAAFVVLVTPEPSVIRASVMAALGMLALLLGRPSAGVPILCLAVTGILLVDPWLATSPGFALSAAATGALLSVARPLARGLGRWMPTTVALALAVPISTQLVCGPIVALFSEQQSLVSVPANLLAAPAAPLATVVGLLACLSAPVPVLADFFAATAWLPSAWIATTATTAIRLPGATLLVVPGLLSAGVVLTISAAIAVLLWRAKSGKPARRGLRRSATVIVVIVCALGGARILLTGPLSTLTVPAEWSIAACDVGQGDALLVKSAGRTALIDTGPDPAALRTCLSALGVDRIDLLVLTHFDLDHVGGVDAVLARVTTVLHGPVSEHGEEMLLSSLRDAGAAVVEASAGQSGVLGNTRWRVLWPRATQAAFPSGNDASVVIEFAGGNVPTSLFLGDLSAVPQQLLLASGSLSPPYTVVKVAHHGSADQNAGLYRALAPVAAIFSAGEGNDYGHPRQESLDVLAATGAAILRTDQQGWLLLGIREGELAVWVEKRQDDSGAGIGGSGDG